MESPLLAGEQERVAIKDPEHLIRWLRETGREYLVLKAEDLVRGQAWPDGIDALMHIIAGYRSYRSTQKSGRFQEVRDAQGDRRAVETFKGEQLEDDELDQCLRWLVAQRVERDPDWHWDRLGT